MLVTSSSRRNFFQHFGCFYVSKGQLQLGKLSSCLILYRSRSKFHCFWKVVFILLHFAYILCCRTKCFIKINKSVLYISSFYQNFLTWTKKQHCECKICFTKIKENSKLYALLSRKYFDSNWSNFCASNKLLERSHLSIHFFLSKIFHIT